MQAILHPIEPFDATTGTTLSFTWKGNQIFQVRCVIRENESGLTVYDQTQDTMKASFHLPANSGLGNGGYYVASITVFDRNGIQSQPQNIGTPFYCFRTPRFSLSIEEGDVIRTSSFLTALLYSQDQQEPLDSFTITLYSHQKVQLQTSGLLYNTDELSYLISGLEDGTPYLIRATGQTLHGIQVDTGFIAFTAAYQQKQLFSTIEANNKPELGCIELRSNIISTEGVSIRPVVFLDQSKADLRDNAVIFSVGYQVAGDNSHVFAFSHPRLNHMILSMESDSKDMTVRCTYREGIFEDSNEKKALMEVSACCHGVTYTVYSNYIPLPGPKEQLLFCLNRIHHFFEPKLLLLPERRALSCS